MARAAEYALLLHLLFSPIVFGLEVKKQVLPTTLKVAPLIYVVNIIL